MSKGCGILMKYLVGALLMGLLAACAPMKLADFKKSEPTFDLFEYFDGTTKAYGLFEDRFGKIKRQFTVTIEGKVSGDTLTLDEDFVYDDGELQNRVWTITRLGDGSYEGVAADIIGKAQRGGIRQALNWSYDLALTIGGREIEMHFDDWMFRQSDDVVLNRATVSKFGITLGSVTLAFVRQK